MWLFVLGVPNVYAESLRIQPLKYEATLKDAEAKKGYVDVTNPSSEMLQVRLYVQEFRQVDDEGALEFTDNEQYKEAIQLDYDLVSIEPRQTLRLFFTIHPKVLPEGDIFAVIFAENIPHTSGGLQTAVRVGTLLMVTNQTSGERQAAIRKLEFARLQIGDGLNGAISVANIAAKGSASGFFPHISFATVPFGPRFERTGPLVMAGRARSMEVYEPMNLAGVYKVTVQVAAAQESRYVVMITGYWRWVVPLLVIGGAGAIYGAVRYIRVKRAGARL